MVQDLRDGDIRSRIDDALAGRIPVAVDALDGLPPDSPGPMPSRSGVPPMSSRPTEEEMRRLRENWGRPATAQQAQRNLDDFLRNVPRQNPKMN